jgi:hypothetical protein
MELPNSGDNIEFYCPDMGAWTPIEHMRFEEAKTYRWRSAFNEPFLLLFNNLPLPMIRTGHGWEGEVMTPFQSGSVSFTIEQTSRRVVESFLYSDHRKINEAEYQTMIADILTEAAACFQHHGASMNFNSSGIDREISIAQWDYIERSFYRLQQLYRGIQHAPIRRLKAQDRWMRREHVKHVTPSLLAWSERHQ